MTRNKPRRSVLLLLSLAAIYAHSMQAGGADALVLNAAPGSPSKVLVVAGLDNIKPNAKGILLLNQDALVFYGTDAHASIPVSQLVGASIGDQRVEPWGTVGKLARKAIPYGGGSVLGAVTGKSVDLLIVEYRDDRHGRHGAIFVLPSKTASDLRDRIAASLTTANLEAPSACAESSAKPNTILVAPVAVDGVQLLEEYRVLLYERLIAELKLKRPNDTYIRTGDLSSGAGCSAYILETTVVGFKKGNQALRASTGPVGLFLGTTQLSLKVRLQAAPGSTVFEQQLRKSVRTDSESLDLARSVARSVSKRLNKELTRPAQSS